MAVDANILINDRILEETRKGASAFKALDVGFKQAYSTIFDANVTTLLEPKLLFSFGSVPVQVFAVTRLLVYGIPKLPAVTLGGDALNALIRHRPLTTPKL